MFQHRFCIGVSLCLAFIAIGCTRTTTDSGQQGFEVKFLVGSALGNFCQQAATQYNAQSPKISDGKAFHLVCTAQGSGDVVTEIVSRSQQLKDGTLKADSDTFPTLISVDGDIYQTQLVSRISQIFPGQRYIPDVTDAPLIASSPVVFMTQADLAPSLRKAANPFSAFETAKTFKDIDPASRPVPIHYVHTAPNRSNSGLLTLIAQFAAVSGKRPEQLTVEDIRQNQAKVQQIQRKITRYGTSTDSLAKSMVKNGAYWASVASVYESSVIAANDSIAPGQPRYEAVYPKATFTSNMRAILPKAPWISADERAAAEQVIEYLRSPAVQEIAATLGLRPGLPGVALGPKFTAAAGVDPQARYDSYRAPSSEVVNAMLTSWESYAKKPSKVVLVVDSSGSMAGDKLPAVQATLQSYINHLGSKEEVALIDFDGQIRPPIVVDGTPQGKSKGIEFVNSLQAQGGTKLYDAALYSRNWLAQNLRKDGINAVVILTDGEDSGSSNSLDQVKAELQKSGFGSDQRIAFFTVGYGKSGEFDASVLQQIADRNGGYYSQGDPESIARLMANLQTEF